MNEELERLLVNTVIMTQVIVRKGNGSLELVFRLKNRTQRHQDSEMMENGLQGLKCTKKPSLIRSCNGECVAAFYVRKAYTGDRPRLTCIKSPDDTSPMQNKHFFKNIVY